MAPTGQKTPVSKYIVDLDSATTNGKKLKRIKSINNTAVWRPAKCVAAATQENDDLNPRETTDKLFLEEEDDLEDGKLMFLKNSSQNFTFNRLNLDFTFEKESRRKEAILKYFVVLI